MKPIETSSMLATGNAWQPAKVGSGHTWMRVAKGASVKISAIWGAELMRIETLWACTAEWSLRCLCRPVDFFSHTPSSGLPTSVFRLRPSNFGLPPLRPLALYSNQGNLGHRGRKRSNMFDSCSGASSTGTTESGRGTGGASWRAGRWATATGGISTCSRRNRGQ
jgi:hypothetical protein